MQMKMSKELQDDEDAEKVMNEEEDAVPLHVRDSGS